MERKKIITWCLSIFIVILIIVLLQWRAVNVILNLEENNYKIGDSLSGKLSITLEPGDSISAETPILIALIKDNSVLAVETLTLKEFIEKSDNRIESVKFNGNDYYETAGNYNSDASNFINYEFNEGGEYELFFNIFGLDISMNRKIIVS